MRLSVLDQAPVTKGNTGVDALRKSEELAVLADELGYYRMWMAEHHGIGSVVSSGNNGGAACGKNGKYPHRHRRCHDDALFAPQDG